MPDPILVDLYPADLHGHPELLKLAEAGYPWCGVWLKTNQGLKFYDDAWFNRLWSAALEAGKRTGRLGVDWFRGTYDYADLDASPVAEAEFALSRVEAAGGWVVSDMNPCIDMEGARNPAKPGAARIEDWLNKYSERMLVLHGRRPTLYGNIYLAENGVQGLCGCEDLIVARYTATLPSTIYTRIGVPLEKVRGWQYRGTEPVNQVQHGYPAFSPLSSTVAVDLTEVFAGLPYLIGHGHVAP